MTPLTLIVSTIFLCAGIVVYLLDRRGQRKKNHS